MSETANVARKENNTPLLLLQLLAFVDTDVAHVAGAREEVAELVVRERHDAIGRVERLLDAVAVMHVDIDVQHTVMISAVDKSRQADGTTTC